LRKKSTSRWIAPLLSLAIGLAGARVSAAPREAPRDPKAVARAKLLEGAKLLEHGEYEEALARFQEAYAKVPSPKIFYNCGLAYWRLGRNAEAIAAFGRFLAEAPDAPTYSRDDADRRRRDLLKKVATVEISSDTEGAEILIDGTSYGQTPRKEPIYLNSGNHLLSVRRGAAQQVQRLTTEQGQKQIITVALLPSDVAAAQPPQPRTMPPKPQAPSEDPGRDPAPVPEAPGSSSGLRLAAWSTGAAAVAFLAGGAVEMIVASHKLDTFQSTPAPDGSGRSCGTDRDRYGGGACETLHDEWSSARTLGLVGLIGGGVLAATSITSFALSTNHGGGPKLACALVSPGTGISCAARF
jgi:hypothetical protein